MWSVWLVDGTISHRKLIFPLLPSGIRATHLKISREKKKSTIIGAVINTKGNVNYVPEEIWQLENLRINIPKL